MILGNKNYFAIEFQLASQSCGMWLYGQCCFWVEGKRLGDYDKIISLGDLFSEMHVVVKDCGKRQSDWIDHNAKEIFDYLNYILYRRHHDDDEYDIEMPDRYGVNLDAGSFGGVKIFLLDCDILTSRFIYSEDDGDTVNEVRLVPGEFDSVIKRFYLELSKLNEEAEPHGWLAE